MGEVRDWKQGMEVKSVERLCCGEEKRLEDEDGLGIKRGVQ